MAWAKAEVAAGGRGCSLTTVPCGATFEEERRGKAIGTWAGFTGITSVLGPVLGGYLVENLSWRWVFFINIPLAVAVLVLTLTRVPESRDPQAGRLDLPGAALATVGLGGVVFGLIEYSSRGFADPLVLGPLAIGAAALVAFLAVEHRSREPMLPLSMFRSRNFAGVNNAFSRTASLLAIAVLGVLMFVSFSGALDARVSDFDLPTGAERQSEESKGDLGAAQPPEELGAETAAAVDRSIAEAFHFGFRVVMLAAAGIALASATAAALMIEGGGSQAGLTPEAAGNDSRQGR